MKQVDEISKKFYHIDADSLIYNGVRFFQSYPDTIIAVINNNDEFFDIFYSSRSEQHFSEIDNIICEIMMIDN